MGLWRRLLRNIGLETPLTQLETGSSAPTFTLKGLDGKSYSGGGVSVLGVSQDDARSTKEFNEEFGVKFPTLIDDTGYPVSNAYGLTSVPTVLLIAPDGRIKVGGTGFSKRDLALIAEELAEHRKLSAVPLFRSDEVVPDFKPG